MTTKHTYGHLLMSNIVHAHPTAMERKPSGMMSNTTCGIGTTEQLPCKHASPATSKTKFLTSKSRSWLLLTWGNLQFNSISSHVNNGLALYGKETACPGREMQEERLHSITIGGQQESCQGHCGRDGWHCGEGLSSVIILVGCCFFYFAPKHGYSK